MSGINLEKETEDSITQDDKSKKLGKQPVTLNINLLGYEVREEIAKNSGSLKLSKPMIIGLSLVGIAILLNIISYLLLVSLKDEQALIKTGLERRKVELEAKNKELTDKVAQRDILLQKKNILLWATGNNFKWSALLEEVRDRTPSNVWVNKIDVNDALLINITGETFDHKTVALFLANLQDSPKFRNVVLDSTKKMPKLKIRQLEELGNNTVERTITSNTKFTIHAEVVVTPN